MMFNGVAVTFLYGETVIVPTEVIELEQNVPLVTPAIEIVGYHSNGRKKRDKFVSNAFTVKNQTIFFLSRTFLSSVRYPYFSRSMISIARCEPPTAISYRSIPESQKRLHVTYVTMQLREVPYGCAFTNRFIEHLQLLFRAFSCFSMFTRHLCHNRAVATPRTINTGIYSQIFCLSSKRYESEDRLCYTRYMCAAAHVATLVSERGEWHMTWPVTPESESGHNLPGNRVVRRHIRNLLKHCIKWHVLSLI